jgi:hypothetical protein
LRQRTVLLSLAALACCIFLGAVFFQPNGPFAGPTAMTSPDFYPIVLSNLRNTVSNVGTFGTKFGSSGPSFKSEKFPPGPVGRAVPISSCEWPAGSRNMYLNEGELWVGALVNGDTVVTTGRLSGLEWSPVEEITKTNDISAFSDEDTYTRYQDTGGEKLSLDVQVSQRTFAWAGSDFIVHDLLVENIGSEDLEDVYVAFFWDFNVSSDAPDGGAPGDMAGLDESRAISYMFDADGDNGRSPGYVGGKFLNTPLAGYAWWNESQDPESDSRRYALLSAGLMPDPEVPDDYRLLQSVGPFDLAPGRIIPVLYVLAIGNDPDELQQAVTEAEDLVGLERVAEGDSTLQDGQLHEIAVNLGEDKRQLAQVQYAVDWEFCEVELTVVDPNGEEIDPDLAQGNPMINYTAGPHRKSYDITNPMPGEWLLRIGFVSGEGPILYHHSVTLFDTPYDFGLPMEYFQVYSAYIYFDNIQEPPVCPRDSFSVWGEFRLKEESAFDPTVASVIFRMGPYDEIIPPGSFHEVESTKSPTYEYSSEPPGITYMRLSDYYECWDFEVHAEELSMVATENPVLVRLAVGPDTGFEWLEMTEADSLWWYGLYGHKASPRTFAQASSRPRVFSLSQNYPNPFNASTAIDYYLGQSANIQLSLYNVRGQRVAVLAEGLQPAGTHRVIWDGKDSLGRTVASGIYLCHLRAGGITRTRKMILLR